MIKGNKAKMTGVFIFMLIAFVVSAYPFYAMIINATSTNKEIFSGKYPIGVAQCSNALACTGLLLTSLS